MKCHLKAFSNEVGKFGVEDIQGTDQNFFFLIACMGFDKTLCEQVVVVVVVFVTQYSL